MYFGHLSKVYKSGRLLPNMRASGNPVLVQAFATELLARRQELRWSQEDVALRSNIDRAYISRLEAGKKTPSLSVLHALATGLDLSFAELAGRIDERYRQLKRKRSAVPAD